MRRESKPNINAETTKRGNVKSWSITVEGVDLSSVPDTAFLIIHCFELRQAIAPIKLFSEKRAINVGAAGRIDYVADGGVPLMPGMYR